MIQQHFGRPRRGYPGQIIGARSKTLSTIRVETDYVGKAISLIDGSHQPIVRADSSFAVDRSFVGVLAQTTTDLLLLSAGKIFVETGQPVKKDDPVLVAVSDGTFATGTPSPRYPVLLNASYLDDSDEHRLVTLELHYADYIYRIIKHYLEHGLGFR